MKEVEQGTMTPSRQRSGSSQGHDSGLYRGRISAVWHPDQSAAKQLLVDVYMYDLMPPLDSVPVLAAGMGGPNGGQATPEVGDLGLVAFIAGQIRDPIVVGFVPMANNPIQATAQEAPHFRRQQNGTRETVKKDGTREVYVAKDEILTIKGHGTVVVQEGNLNIDVQTGNVTITVAGDASIQAQGNLEATATGNATVSAAAVNVEAAGAVNVTGGGAITATGTGNVSVTAGAICTIQSTGTMNVHGTADVNVSATGNVNISGANVAISG